MLCGQFERESIDCENTEDVSSRKEQLVNFLLAAPQNLRWTLTMYQRDISINSKHSNIHRISVQFGRSSRHTLRK